MFSLLSPCTAVRDFLFGSKDGPNYWNCDSVSPFRYFLVFLSLLAVAVLADALYRERITLPEPYAKWFTQLKTKGVENIEAWEVCVIGLPIGLYLFLIIIIIDGYSVWSWFFILAPVVVLFVLQYQYISQKSDPHKDIPDKLRSMSLEEIKMENERLEAFNRTRELLGQQFDLLEHAKSLQEINEKVAMLKKAFPSEKEDLDLAGQVMRERLERNVK